MAVLHRAENEASMTSWFSVPARVCECVNACVRYASGRASPLLSLSLSLLSSRDTEGETPPTRTNEGRRGERVGRKGEETVRQTDVETEAGDGGSARRNRDEGNELKREDPRWRTNDWWKKGGGGGASKRGDTPTVGEEHEPRGVTCQSSPRGNDSRSRGISMG